MTKPGLIAAKDLPLREGMVLRLGDRRWWKILTVADKEVRYTVPFNGNWSTMASVATRDAFNEVVDKDAEGAEILPDDSIPTWSVLKQYVKGWIQYGTVVCPSGRWKRMCTFERTGIRHKEWTKIMYEKMSTRYLLARLRYLRRIESRGPNWDVLPWSPAVYAEIRREADALKIILATREHVPSKLEGKVARRAAATAHRGPKKLLGKQLGKTLGKKLNSK